MAYKAQIKGRKKSSQITGYKVVEEFQFIITVMRKPDVNIVGRWFDTRTAARAAAIHAAKILGIELTWAKEAA